jgi:putative membrane protein
MCVSASEAVTWWTSDPLVMSAIAGSTTVYTLGLRRLWRTVGTGAGIRPVEACAYYLGQLTLVIALISPIDRLSDLLFSAHMAQHELLMIGAPPLIVLGRPVVALAWAFDPRSRARIMRAATSAALRRAWRIVSGPLFILVLHGAVLWAWHIPPLFEAALQSELVHAAQHLSFFLTAMIFWWAVARGRYGRAGYGLASAFVFATAMHTSILGALLTVASRLWYPLYAARGRAWQVDALEDQQLAGLVMWVPAGVLLGLLALGLFAAWLGEAGRRVRRADRSRAQPAIHEP